MKTRVVKKVRSVVASVLAFLLLLLSASCSANHALTNELPDEEVVGIVRVFVNESFEESKSELSKDKIGLFLDHIHDLTYKKQSNLFGIKSKVFDSVTYVISYEHYTVKLSEHHLLVLHNDENEKEITFAAIQPSDAFDKIEQLFE